MGSWRQGFFFGRCFVIAFSRSRTLLEFWSGREFGLDIWGEEAESSAVSSTAGLERFGVPGGDPTPEWGVATGVWNIKSFFFYERDNNYQNFYIFKEVIIIGELLETLVIRDPHHYHFIVKLWYKNYQNFIIYLIILHLWRKRYL